MENLNPNQPKLLDRLRGHRLSATFTLMAALSAGIVAGSVLTRGASAREQQSIDTSDARPLTIPAPITSPNAFSKIAKEVGPAVVNINTESLPKESAVTPRRGRNGLQRGPEQAVPSPDEGNGNQGDMQDFLRRFFGGQGGGEGDDGEGMGSHGGRALGSGFIVDPRGYIITNNHVVNGADRIYVKLSTDPDGVDQGRPARVVGVDKETDIAVIKIDAKEPLPTVKLGNSDGAQVGDWVLAIGSPFGLAQTVSAGIVSAKNRSNLEERAQFQHFIQTDAAINPGNSGGPLVDMNGQVIGMNTAIYTQSAGSEGVGFAMPSNTIASIYNMLISPEHAVVRGSIGIQFQGALPSAVSRVYGVSNGVLINAITPNQGAAKAGLQPGDVLTSIDGRTIKDGDDLVNDISSRRVGSTVKIGYLRNGKSSTANVQIGDRNKTYAAMGETPEEAPASGAQASDAGQKLGIKVGPVEGNTLSKLGLHGGVQVTNNPAPGSFASDIGLARGTIITEINRKPVTDVASFNSILSGLKSGDDVALGVRAQGDSGIQFIGGTLP